MCSSDLDSAASLLKEDPQLVRFIQQEQSHLEQQARKLGFDVKKRPAHDDDAYQAPRESVPPSAPAHAKPSNLSMPTAQEVEKDKVAVELREKERQKRAQAFLERELRAKERAEQALKQLQKEKQERLRALQEQREMRQKRMSNVHPRGEAGLMNDWQKRLQQAQMQHEERRRQMGMVPGDHRPKPPPKSKLHDEADRRNDKRLKPDPAAADKENVKNIFDRQNQEVKKKDKEKQEQKIKEAEAVQYLNHYPTNTSTTILPLSYTVLHLSDTSTTPPSSPQACAHLLALACSGHVQRSEEHTSELQSP